MKKKQSRILRMERRGIEEKCLAFWLAGSKSFPAFIHSELALHCLINTCNRVETSNDLANSFIAFTNVVTQSD